MSIEIRHAVGAGGVNRRPDVMLIQILLNLAYPTGSAEPLLKVDGMAGPRTAKAIRQFQGDAIAMMHPDGRVDPGGKTFQYLTMYLSTQHEKAIAQAMAGDFSVLKRLTRVKKDPVTSAGLANYSVNYSSRLSASKHVVSEYAKQIVRVALKQAGMSHAVITSTIRTPEEQARIMLRNAKIDLAAQYRLYGRNGDAVLDVFKENKTKTDAEIVSLMVSKIESLEDNGKRVSKHCVSLDLYKKRNVFDIGFNSTKTANRKFNPERLAKAFSDLKREGYIATFIDETRKSNKAWHLEVKVGAKPISKIDDGSILNTVNWINKKAVA